MRRMNLINGSLRKWRNKQGMTMAELLIVVAIIAVLSGVAFVAVWTYQRSMGQLERDGIAKQIFIAAQNHLTAARGEGYLGISNFGTEGKATSDLDASGKPKGNYYYVVTKGSASAADPDKADEIFRLMLPFGALDETVLRGGSYLIRYNRDSGTVMDVFYCTTNGSPNLFNHELTPDEYGTVLDLAGDENKSNRRIFVSGNNSILGWYGGAEGIPHGEQLENPRITVHNEELLWVDVTDTNAGKGASLKLKIVGESSNAEMVIVLRNKDGNNTTADGAQRIKWDGNTCHVILDDITSLRRHFADLNDINDSIYNRNGSFWWGETIKIQAIAENESALTNIGYSGGGPEKWEITNSLFDTGSNSTALIRNFRHFENLDKTLAGFQNAASVTVSKAEQTRDMIWKDAPTGSTVKDFKQAVKDIKSSIKDTDATFRVYAGNSAQTEGCLYPVSPDYVLSYDGKNHQTSNVEVNIGKDAGLFGTMTENGSSSISNLELLDFKISSTSGNAGALIGTAENVTVTNVLARHTPQTESYKTVNVTASGNAGGLIGSASNTTVTKSAAALVINGSASAGGLIGTMTGGTVRASYAGGHTNNATYFTNSSDPIYNVTGGTAGGLIGSLTNGTVTGSYSTCSASGTTAGGFVGKGDGSPVIKNCYCTGLVLEPKDSINSHGAFAGSLTGTTSNCQYFEIINEIDKGELGFDCLSAIGGGASKPGISAFDETAASYEAFCNHTWKPAKPYDPALMTLGYYNGNYNLMTVDQLNETLTESDKVTIRSTDFVVKDYSHYGDWPAPEAFVINK